MSPASRRNATPRVLLVGPLPIEGDVIGGTKVLFAELAEDFAASKRFDATVVNTSRPLRARGPLGRVLWNAWTFLRVLAAVWAQAPSHDVVLFNASTRGFFASGPWVRLACRARRTPLVVRLFGGDLAQRYDALTRARRRWIARTALRCDLLLVETEGLRERFAAKTAVRRFPNTRSLEPRRDDERTSGPLRFLFLGQVRHEKGFLHALEACDRLETDARVEFHGPLMEGVDPAIFAAHPRAGYHGVVDPADLRDVLVAHDVLLFPTRYRTEGMPGVVLEAMQVGLPVIASRWPAAHEMIVDGENGLLVDVGSTASLAQAMRVLERSPELRERLAEAARDTGDAYRRGPWFARLERALDELLGRATTAVPGSDVTPTEPAPAVRKEVA